MNWELHHAHDWQVSPVEAIGIQKTLAPLVRAEPLEKPIHTIAGVDMSVRGDQVQAAVAVLRMSDMALIDQALWQGTVQFPYVPGLLSFREIPALLAVLDKLSVRPDLIMTDSQGLAHTRRFGLACHLGVLLDCPTIGVAKTRFMGEHIEVGTEKGDQAPLREQEEVIGAVLRTRNCTQRRQIRPVYVSIGHRITLPEAVALTLACTTQYRLPEPTRQAHLLSISNA